MHAASAWIEKDCSQQVEYPKLKTEVRGFWTDSDLYLLFVSPYSELNLWLPADNSKDRLKVWDRDVVEFFLGDDWSNIKHYREFEIAPTGDWVDLAIDLTRDSWLEFGVAAAGAHRRKEPRLVRGCESAPEVGQ